MPRSESLLHDHAWAQAHALLDLVAHLLREEEQREAFAEFGIPLLKGGKLNLDEAIRGVWYTGSGSAQPWKTGISFQVTPRLRLRATESNDVRAPTLRERFESQRGGVNGNDPANGNARISTANYSGGNPDVGLETARTSVYGFV